MKIRTILTVAMCATAVAVALSGCGANSAAQLDALKGVITDTNCSHDDKISVVTGAGGIAGSFTASAERHCPVGGAVKAADQAATSKQ